MSVLESSGACGGMNLGPKDVAEYDRAFPSKPESEGADRPTFWRLPEAGGTAHLGSPQSEGSGRGFVLRVSSLREGETTPLSGVTGLMGKHSRS